jgi:hypothetical protein
MPLYRVAFQEHGGYRCQCRIRAAAGADHIDLAVKKIWGDVAYWTWVPGSDTEGRVYERRGAEPGPHDFPRTNRATVEVAPATRRTVRVGL